MLLQMRHGLFAWVSFLSFCPQATLEDMVSFLSVCPQATLEDMFADTLEIGSCAGWGGTHFQRDRLATGGSLGLAHSAGRRGFTSWAAQARRQAARCARRAWRVRCAGVVRDWRMSWFGAQAGAQGGIRPFQQVSAQGGIRRFNRSAR